MRPTPIRMPGNSRAPARGDRNGGIRSRRRHGAEPAPPRSWDTSRRARTTGRRGSSTSPAVEQHDRLAARAPQVGEREARARVQRVMASAHVKDLDGRHRGAVNASREPQPAQRVGALRARRGGAGDQHRGVRGRAALRHGTGVVARIALMLVGAFMLLINDDHPDVPQRSEDRRARANAHARLPALERKPFVASRSVTHPRVQHRDDLAEPRLEAGQRLRRERDLRHEDDRRATGLQSCLDGPEIHLGLARAGDPVQQKRAAGARCLQRRQDRRERRVLLGTQRRCRARRGGDVVACRAAHLGGLPDRHQPPRLQAAHRGAAELRGGRLAPARERRQQRALTLAEAQRRCAGLRAGARLHRLRCAGRRAGAQRCSPGVGDPGAQDLARHHPAPRPRRQHHGERPSSRRAVLARHPLSQLDEFGRQRNRQHAARLGEPLRSDLRAFGELGHHPDHVARGERHAQQRADLDAALRFGQPVVEQARDRARTRERDDARDHATRLPQFSLTLTRRG